VAITGPKPRTVTDKIKGVYDVNELFDYDSQTETTEFITKYDFSKLEDTDYHILIDYNWYTQNIDSGLKEPSFVYNLSDKIYHDEPTQKELVMAKFKVFDATELYRKKPTLINKIPKDHYHVLLDQKWLKKNLSEKYLKRVNEEHHPLVFPSEEVFSFGVALNTLDTNNTSYQISLCLYDRENPKDEEIKWAVKYEELATICRDYLKKSEFKKFKGQIDAMKGLSWKSNEVGDVDGPKLYPKIMYNQKKQEFITIFMDENDEIIEDPKIIIDKRARIKVALRFESIFVGSKVALQVRVNDVLISKLIEPYRAKSLILRRKPQEKSPIKNIKVSNKSEDDSDLNSSSSEDEEAIPIKRVVKTIKL
jgi:Txe/YoeB family toxin of Txe-Axe toxin-antitoxin module